MKSPRPRTSKAALKAPDPEPFGACGNLEVLWKAAGQVFYQCPHGGGAMRFRGAAQRLLGSDDTVMEGGRAEWTQRIHPDDQAEVAARDAALKENQPETLDYRFLCPGGEVAWLRETRCLARDTATGAPLLSGTLADVTAARQAAARLRRYQKMNVFGECARGIAHDINNILSLFQGYAELLQDDLAPGSPGEEYVNEMLSAVERARELTRSIHRVCHLKPGQPAATNCVTLLADFTSLLRRLAGEQIELAIVVGPGEAWVKADPLELETLLLNLAANACEAMPRGGRLEIELARAAGRVTLTVRDSGEGIRKADLPRIFQPGFTTRQRLAAEGMGLAVCREIAEGSGGRITCKSTPGKGSEFRAVFPAVAAPADKPSPEEGPAPAAQGERILIAEDDAHVRKALAAMLKHLGYTVHEASNGEEALRWLEKEPKIRLVISDCFMPIMGGGELAGMIQSRWPGIPVILTSGYASPISPEQLNQFRLFLPKPLATNILARHIRKLIDV